MRGGAGNGPASTRTRASGNAAGGGAGGSITFPVDATGGAGEVSAAARNAAGGEELRHEELADSADSATFPAAPTAQGHDNDLP